MVYEITTKDRNGGCFVARAENDVKSLELIELFFKEFEADPALTTINAVREEVKARVAKEAILPQSYVGVRFEPDAYAAVKRIAMHNYHEFAAADRE